MPAPHQSNFYRLDALSDVQPTVSKALRAYVKQTHKLETVSIAEPLQNRQHAQNP